MSRASTRCASASHGLARGAAPRGEVWLNFVVKQADTIVGRIEATNYGAWAEIAYLIGPTFQRQGFGREVVGWLVAQLHEAGCESVWACVHPKNVRSIGLLDRLHFVKRNETGRRLTSHEPGDLLFEHATTRP
jgi:RimJ/RimL family protein N-acetyltransferase